MDRRSFLKASAATAAVGSVLGPDFWRAAYASPAQPGVGPYGPLQPADANLLQLPAGFTSRIVAVEGQVPVPSADPGRPSYTWHTAPDGAATFAAPDGGWVLCSNSEGGAGNSGVGAIRFAADGTLVDSYAVLRGTNHNCAGGPTPWGTWLSCEEAGNAGTLWECDPFVPQSGPNPAQRRAAFGFRNHEAVAVDPAGHKLYLTEDASTGRLYRFTPTNPDLPSGAYDLSAGVLEAAFRNNDDASGLKGLLTWVPVTNLTTGYRGADSSPFNGGEGIWYDEGFVYWACKGDNTVWSLELATQRFELIYRPNLSTPSGPLTGVDNVLVSQFSGDIFVAEDGGSLDICLITPDDGAGNRVVTRFCTVASSSNSEVAGPCFSPDGTRMYLSSQRGFNSGTSLPSGVNASGRGVTFEITGPFRTTREIEVPQGGGLTLSTLAGGAALTAGAAALLGRRSRPAADVPV